MTIAIYGGMAMLTVAGALTLVRITRGPRMLDRVIAADVLLATVMAALALEAAVNRHATTLPVLVVLALVGFVGSVSMARFTASERTATLPAGDGTEEVSTNGRDRDIDLDDADDRADASGTEDQGGASRQGGSAGPSGWDRSGEPA